MTLSADVQRCTGRIGWSDPYTGHEMARAPDPQCIHCQRRTDKDGERKAAPTYTPGRTCPDRIAPERV